MRELLESPGGALWATDSNGTWRQTSCYEWPIDKQPIQLNQQAIETLQQDGKIINLTGLSDTANSEWPPALLNGKQPWLLIPLNSHGKLQAIIQIGQSHSLPTQLDWEDVALVTAASHQVGAYLAFHQATDALAQARQFEDYNRLSAFLVHDLKNVVGQLQLLVQNSRQHAPSVVFSPELDQNPDQVTKLMVLCNRERMLNVLLYLV
jgi:GAF domain-containing protein